MCERATLRRKSDISVLALSRMQVRSKQRDQSSATPCEKSQKIISNDFGLQRSICLALIFLMHVLMLRKKASCRGEKKHSHILESGWLDVFHGKEINAFALCLRAN